MAVTVCGTVFACTLCTLLHPVTTGCNKVHKVHAKTVPQNVTVSIGGGKGGAKGLKPPSHCRGEAKPPLRKKLKCNAA